MDTADGIRKHGFRRWHERRLLTSHGWLLLTLLAGVAGFASLEAAFNAVGWAARAPNVLGVFVSGAIGVFALQRFLAQLVRCQTAASQASCEVCKTYGRLDVMAEDTAASRLRVRCRQCGHQWEMDDG